MNTQKIFNGKSFRLAVLALAALAGLVMNDQAVEVLESIFRWFWDGNTLDDAVLKWLKLVVVGLPVFLALWVFRTSDTRQQIEKTQAQIEQSNFATGMQNLIAREPMQVEIGVQILLGVSKNTSEFDANIRLAFVKRLKELPAELQGRNIDFMRANRLSYAQHILRWLIDKVPEHGRTNLSGMDCRFQEFPDHYNKLRLADIVKDWNPKELDIIFAYANCIGIDFNGVDLANYDFTGVSTSNTGKEIDFIGYDARLLTRPPKGIDPQQWYTPNVGGGGIVITQIEVQPPTLNPGETVEVLVDKNFFAI